MAVGSSPPLPPPPRGQRIEAVNLIRAFVCVGIMTRHFATAPQFVPVWGPAISGSIDWVPASECFLVVSGYFLAHMFRRGDSQFLSLRSFALRRMYRLVIPYWAALTIAYTGLPFWRAAVPGTPIRDVYLPAAIISNYLCVPDLFGFAPPLLFFWTIATLIQVYVVWSVLFWTVRRAYLAAGVAEYHDRTIGFVVTMTGVAVFASGAWAWGGLAPEIRWQLPRWCVYTAAGAYSYWRTRGMVSRGAFAVVLAFMLVGAVWAESQRPLFGSITAGLLVLATAHDIPRGPLVLRLIGGFGAWSYSIYLMHGLVGRRVWAVLNWVGLPQDSLLLALAYLITAMAASILAGYVFFRLVERPLTDRAARVQYRA